MQFIHARLASTVQYYVIAMMLWGLWRFWRKKGFNSSYWGSVMIAGVLILVQGLLGSYLWLSGERPAQEVMHILYGLVGVIALPATFGYTKGIDDRRTTLVYALVFMALIGIFIRAVITGSGN
jgi:heme A synthase